MPDVKKTGSWLNEQKSRMKKTLSSNIYNRRKQLGLTQEQVAERAKMSIETIGKLETQKQWFSIDSLLLLCKALELTPSQLFLDRDADSMVPLADVQTFFQQYGEHCKDGGDENVSYSIRNTRRKR